MRFPQVQSDWPESWRLSFRYDLLELPGTKVSRRGRDLGYARAYRQRQSRTLAAVARVAPPGSTVLDVAAAQGNFSLALAERDYRVTWNDLREELVPYVRAKYEFGDLRFAAGNALELEFPALFDVVLATEVIEHVAHPDRFITQLATLVRPGGAVVVTTPNGAYWRNTLPRFSECVDPEQFEGVQFRPDADGHIFLLHPDELPLLAERAGLVLHEVELFTNPLTRGALRLDRLLPYVPERLVTLLERVTASSRRFAWLNMQMLAVFRRPVAVPR